MFSIKAPVIFQEIIEEEARAKAIEEAKNKKLPVKMKGLTIGWATVNPDGTFTADLESSLMGLELLEYMSANPVNSLSVVPNTRPFEDELRDCS